MLYVLLSLVKNSFFPVKNDGVVNTYSSNADLLDSSRKQKLFEENKFIHCRVGHMSMFYKKLSHLLHCGFTPNLFPYTFPSIYYLFFQLTQASNAPSASLVLQAFEGRGDQLLSDEKHTHQLPCYITKKVLVAICRLVGTVLMEWHPKCGKEYNSQVTV